VQPPPGARVCSAPRSTSSHSKRERWPRIESGPAVWFAYVVTLTNTGIEDRVTLPCPGYTESLGLYLSGRWQVEQSSYELNCSSVRRLLAGQSRRFAMRIRVPADAQPGSVKLVCRSTRATASQWTWRDRGPVAPQLPALLLRPLPPSHLPCRHFVVRRSTSSSMCSVA